MTVDATQARSPKEVLAYLEIPLRRPLAVIIPVIVVTAGAVIASLVLPKKYSSSTLILVESEKVPDSFVQKVATDASKKRLFTIRQEVLSRTRLESVIKDTDPYPARIGSEPISDIIEDMRGAIRITTREDDAFSIEYVHTDPRKAQQVADRLTNLFIEETVKTREEQVKGAAGFIEAQLEGARTELEGQEKALRLYKERHMGSLPEQTQANLATLQRLQLEETALGTNLQAARDRVSLLERDLSPTVPGSPIAELEKLRGELAALRVRYTEQHPDVRALLARITRLEKEMETPREARDAGQLAARAQLEQARLEVASIEAKRKDLADRLAMFQGRVELAPRTEQELATLTRDYQKLRENYLELLKKKMDAQMAERLEARWKGENFRVLDPAHLPAHPVFPSKRLFFAVGLFLGLVAGLGLALVLEYLDDSIKDEEQLEALLPLPVLATFPHVDEDDLNVQPGGRHLPPVVSAVVRALRR